MAENHAIALLQKPVL